MQFQDLGFGALLAVMEEEDNMALSKEEKAFHDLPETDQNAINLMYNLDVDHENLTNLNGEKMGSLAYDDETNTMAEDLRRTNITSDGKSADYYKLPADATEIQDLISFKNMNAQIGEMFRGLYRYGQCSHSDEMREIKKIIFYGEAELARLEKYGKK